MWATDAIAQATKIKNLIRAAEQLAHMTRQCKIMLRLPIGRGIVLPWQPDFPVGALQGKAFHVCGILPDRQRLQCLGKDLQGDTVGRSGVLPGDVIDVSVRAD